MSSHSGEWIVVRENQRSARFRNPSEGTIAVLKVKVDGGMIAPGTEALRADYVVAHPKVVDVVVELKGGDVGRAIDQIRATVPVWRKHPLAGPVHAALVVRGQGVHPQTSLLTEKLTRRFQKDFAMKLLIETRNRDYEFAEFLPEQS